MRHSWSISDFPDLPIRAFRKALGKNRPETLEGGKGGSAPQAPDPWNSAAAQTAMNQQTAAYNKALNLGNYSNPFGSQNSTVSGYDSSGAPIYQTNITANPQLQGLLNQQLGNVGQGQNNYQYALGGLRELGPQYTQLNANISGLGLDQAASANAQERGRQAAYEAQTQYLNPQFAQEQESLSAKLAAQGLAPGSQAYNNAMLNFQNQKQRAYSDAANQSILTGSQIGSQNLQNQIASGGFNAGLLGQQAQNLGALGGLYGQQIGANQTGYQNLNSIASLIPGYSGVGQAGSNAADIAGAMNQQYQGQLGAYNARQQSNNATTSSLAGLAGMAAMMFF